MEEVVGGEVGSGGKHLDDEGVVGGDVSLASSRPIADPVVYKLVRVEGDGTLVPATDDEVLEVEDLLEEDKVEQPIIEESGQTERCISSDDLSSRGVDNEDSEGLAQSETLDSGFKKRNARREYIEDMLQKVKEEERLRLLHGVSVDPSKFGGSVSRSSEQREQLPMSDARFLPSPAVMEILPSLTMSSTEDLKNHFEKSEAGIKPIAGMVMNGNFVSSNSNGTKLEASSDKDDICLDNLSIRELQQTFRATFGRDTSVKDKLWLKRRIAMGLTNSCDVSATGFIIKDKSLLFGEEFNVAVNDQNMDDLLFSDKLVNGESSKVPVMLDSKNEDMLAGSMKKSKTTQTGNDAPREAPQVEQRGAKRLRKPTRRYIEELSETDNKETNEKSSSTIKKSVYRHFSQKSQSRTACGIGSAEVTAIVTRQDSFGGSGVQVPFVSRLRRGRPRKNFMGLLHAAFQAGVEASSSETALVPYLGRRRQVLEATRLDPAEDLEEYSLTVPTAKGGTRRKHHRAWTLSEVMRLVEGVSRCGAGRWSEIKRLAFASCAYRTSVDLKDKWRNLLRASAQALTDRALKSSRKHSSIPIPAQILVRVRELAATHPPSTSKHYVKLASKNGKSVHNKPEIVTRQL